MGKAKRDIKKINCSEMATVAVTEKTPQEVVEGIVDAAVEAVEAVEEAVEGVVEEVSTLGDLGANTEWPTSFETILPLNVAATSGIAGFNLAKAVLSKGLPYAFRRKDGRKVPKAILISFLQNSLTITTRALLQRAVIAGFSEETAALFMRNVPRAADTFCAPPSPGASAALNFRGAADVGRVALPALVLSHAAVFTISEAIEVVRYHNHKRLRQRRRIRIAHSVDSDKSLAQAIQRQNAAEFNNLVLKTRKLAATSAGSVLLGSLGYSVGSLSSSPSFGAAVCGIIGETVLYFL